MGKYTINYSKNWQYYFNLIAWNWQILITSETYTTKQSCKDWIASSQINSQISERYKLYKTNNETQFYFTLEAKNWEALWRSEMYNSRSARDNWVSSSKENWNTNTIIDNTL